MKTAYLLGLANVHGNVDHIVVVACSFSRERLMAWEMAQRAPKVYETEPHADGFGQVHAYHLTYKDGPLKWFNPPDHFGGIQSRTWHGTDEEFKARAAQENVLYVE
jgi:hypothetical protein